MNTDKQRFYHIVAINEKTNEMTYMTQYPDTHEHCCTIMKKISYHPARRIQLVEITEM